MLLDREGNAILADFGLARHKPGEVPYETRTGEFFGSFGYIAPEQRKNPRDAVPASDLFSVGATLYHLTTGHRPADLALLDGSPELVAAMHAAVRKVVVKACAYNAADRYADAREMAEAVARAADALALDRMAPTVSAAWMREFDANRSTDLARSRGCWSSFLGMFRG